MNNPVNVDINKIPFETCSCGCFYWKERTIIKKIPALLIGAFKDVSQNVSFMACEKCGKPHPQTTLDFNAEKVTASYPKVAGEPSLSSDLEKIDQMTSSKDSSPAS